MGRWGRARPEWSARRSVDEARALQGGREPTATPVQEIGTPENPLTNLSLSIDVPEPQLDGDVALNSATTVADGALKAVDEVLDFIADAFDSIVAPPTPQQLAAEAAQRAAAAQLSAEEREYLALREQLEDQQRRDAEREREREKNEDDRRRRERDRER